MVDTTTSRRAVLSLAGVGVAALAVPAAATAAPTADPVSAEMRALIATCDRAKRELSAFSRDVFDPARERFLAMKDAVPHVTFQSGDPAAPLRYSTDDRFIVEMCARIVKGAARGEKASPAVADARRLVAAWKRRERVQERLRVTSGFDAVWRENQRLEPRTCDAEDAVIAFPVAGLADLAVKLDFMERIKVIREDGIDDHAARAIIADVRRLTEREG